MNKRLWIYLLLILVVGWGAAFALAYFTHRRGLAAAVFIGTLVAFAYWPVRTRGDD